MKIKVSQTISFLNSHREKNGETRYCKVLRAALEKSDNSPDDDLSISQFAFLMMVLAENYCSEEMLLAAHADVLEAREYKYKALFDSLLELKVFEAEEKLDYTLLSEIMGNVILYTLKPFSNNPLYDNYTDEDKVYLAELAIEEVREFIDQCYGIHLRKFQANKARELQQELAKTIREGLRTNQALVPVNWMRITVSGAIWNLSRFLETDQSLNQRKIYIELLNNLRASENQNRQLSPAEYMAYMRIELTSHHLDEIAIGWDNSISNPTNIADTSRIPFKTVFFSTPQMNNPHSVTASSDCTTPAP